MRAVLALGLVVGVYLHEAHGGEKEENSVTIQALGVEAVRLASADKTVFIDAFAGGIPTFDLGRADVILVTHDDGDHFSAQKVADAAKKTGAGVVGPPTIAYPLLADQKLPPEQLVVLYPKQTRKPIAQEIRGVKIKVYQAQHDGDWNPVHVSYLVELGGKKFFHTGDSSVIPHGDAELENLDVLFHVFNTKDLSKITQLEQVRKKLAPRHIAPIHLLHCGWTATAEEFEREVEKRGLEGFVVLREGQVFDVP